MIHTGAGSGAAAGAGAALAPGEAGEMPATEKDLAENAPWKRIQQNTFTRWCNEHLKCVNKRIANLQTDLSDGLRLIALLEVLSQKKMFRKFNQRPNFRQMQLENVSVGLEFLDRENIKLVSIAGECLSGAGVPGQGEHQTGLHR
ncbi:filamin-A-like [Hemiscyllium ocellatum]|uniref:filamin-A-like n=1 Tax=Hemiscyllium ocellatum TaxID=170820 RepID=UPI002966F133|nr:filamin-A-like [Hemiscyllium ocellatum]